MADSLAVLGLDIGGANVKAAHTAGAAAARRFALWREPHRLGEALEDIVTGLPPWGQVAVTMTAELCDCFATKADGVAAVLAAAGAAFGGGRVSVWTNRGQFLPLNEAIRAPGEVASANWLALATFAGRFAPSGPALVLDVGTTTTDVVPLLDGMPVPRGLTDPMRLMAGELLYRGWRRTPLMVLGDERMAAEHFATAHDVYVALGLVGESADDRDTADGQPATRAAAARRLARLWCAEPDEINVEAAACYLGDRLEDQVGGAIADVVGAMPAWPRVVVVSGSGELLARGGLARGGLADDVAVVSLAERLGPAASEAACAWAVAALAAERGA